MYDPRPSYSATSSHPHIPTPQLIRNHQQNLPNVTFYHSPFIPKRVGWRGGGSAENENRKGGEKESGGRRKEEGESKGESKEVDREEPPAGRYRGCLSIHAYSNKQ